MVFIHSILQKLRSALKNERGEANYFSTVVFIFIAVVLLAFIIDLFGIISTKQELDHQALQRERPDLQSPYAGARFQAPDHHLRYRAAASW